MDRIDIGFVESCESWRLESRFFPSKIGGKPAWLNLQKLPTYNDIQCNICKGPCSFLCQVYAPYDDEPQAFHRTIYIFVCRNTTCCKANRNENLKVLRCQLPRENPFYPFEPPEERDDWRCDIRAEKWVNTCRVCGILALSHCAKCKNASYCCRSHQVLDWRVGHKQQCDTAFPERTNASAKPANLSDVLFPEYEIAMETEEKIMLQDENDDLATELAEMKRFKSLVQSGKAGTLQSETEIDADLQNMSQAENDETFTQFTEEIQKNPIQILRYDRGGTPLYISSSGQPQHIPKCRECNADRQFEFQIMPQLLNYLQFHDVLNSFDWGTLLIFTCKNSCVGKSGYTDEYIWKQDIVEVVSDSVSITND